MNANCPRRVKIEGGGDQVVTHVGLHALGEFADRLGLAEALSAAIPWTGERAPGHAHGKEFTQMMLVLTGGGECCADIEDLHPEAWGAPKIPDSGSR